MMKHVPVLLNAVLDTLGDIRGRTIVDCTFGAGGYSSAFLERGAKVIAFDRDTNVLGDAEKLKQKYGAKFQFNNCEFSQINKLNPENFDDVVFDLGISSMQIDNAPRGFSFRFDAPLDMRMNERLTLNAKMLIEQLSESELADVLYQYGDIKNSYHLARLLKQVRPTTTFQLKDLIKNPKDIAPVFQALRIAVNDEMCEIKSALDYLHKSLRNGGRCVCITFHSIEDSFVKNTFRKWCEVAGNPYLPAISEPEYKLIKPIIPSAQELEQNPRARSAHLRGVVKL